MNQALLTALLSGACASILTVVVSYFTHLGQHRYKERLDTYRSIMSHLALMRNSASYSHIRQQHLENGECKKRNHRVCELGVYIAKHPQSENMSEFRRLIQAETILLSDNAENYLKNFDNKMISFTDSAIQTEQSLNDYYKGLVELLDHFMNEFKHIARKDLRSTPPDYYG